MPSRSLAVIAPPPLKPSEPGVSAAAAASVLRRMGVGALHVDASIGWHRHLLAEDPQVRLALRRAATYADRWVYTSSVHELERALARTAEPFPGLRLGVGMIAWTEENRRMESSAELARLPGEAGPFDAYFIEVLIPELEQAGIEVAAVSLTFQQQAPAALRLLRLLKERLPQVTRVLGGPLVSCWRAAGLELPRIPDAEHLLTGSNADLERLAALCGVAATAGEAAAAGPLAPDLDQAPWDDYLAPSPVIPAALRRGCYWRQCTFCPDHLRPVQRPCPDDAVDRWLHDIAQRFPDGAMLHLTDSALAPAALAHVAQVIHRDHLPIRWHGFVRVERPFADVAFAEQLAQGGCALLQFGVESGSAEQLKQMGKGHTPQLARDVLRVTAAAGIHNQVYLLFGMPRETDEQREQTLELVRDSAPSIHAINPALLNLPLGSEMHGNPERFGITELTPFGTDLSLYDRFRCGPSDPRNEAWRWLNRRFFKDPAVRGIRAHLRTPFKANHLCFIG